MKKLIAISAFCFSLSAFATTVIFPLQLMTGNKHNRTILIQPDISTNQLVNGTNLVGLLPVVVTPTNGVGRASLLPWSYTVRVDGWPKSFHILVPDSTNTLNAVNLITNAVAIGTPVQYLTSGFTGTVTNIGMGLTADYVFSGVVLAGITNVGYATNYYVSAPFSTLQNVFTNGTLGVGLNYFNGSPMEWNVFTNTGSGLLLLYYYADGLDQTNPPSANWTSYDDNSLTSFTFGYTYTTNLVGATLLNISTYTNGVCSTNRQSADEPLPFIKTTGGDGSGLTNIPTSALVREVRWVDALAAGISVAASPTEAPHLIALPGASFADGLAFDHGDIGSFTIQALHVAASTNTDFPQFYYEPHVHVSPAVFVAGQTNTRWVMEWQVAQVLGNFTNTTSLIATNTVGFSHLNHHQILSFGLYTNNLLQGKSSIIFRGGAKRIASASNDVGDAENVILDSVDFHIPTRAVGFGSTSLYSGE
jgi:hypothetical protein